MHDITYICIIFSFNHHPVGLHSFMVQYIEHCLWKEGCVKCEGRCSTHKQFYSDWNSAVEGRVPSVSGHQSQKDQSTWNLLIIQRTIHGDD